MPDIRPTTSAAALVLNATYEPLCVVSVRRATILVLSAKAISVAHGDGLLHSARTTLPVPSVVRLTHYVRVPYRTHVGMSRRAIFARDGGRCAYCRGPAETIDHVVPRSRGGRHAWDNVVAACARCNHSKGDKPQPNSAGGCMSRRPHPRGRRGACSVTVRPTRAGRTGSTCTVPRSRLICAGGTTPPGRQTRSRCRRSRSCRRATRPPHVIRRSAGLPGVAVNTIAGGEISFGYCATDSTVNGRTRGPCEDHEPCRPLSGRAGKTSTAPACRPHGRRSPRRPVGRGLGPSIPTGGPVVRDPALRSHRRRPGRPARRWPAPKSMGWTLRSVAMTGSHPRPPAGMPR